MKIMTYPIMIEHGTPKQLYDEIGLDANAIAQAIRQMASVPVMVNR